MNNLFKKMSYTRVIALSFLLIIFTGACLLTLPFASASHCFTPFLDALFTATSATCVTGLVVYDTATYWSTAGQLIILLLIQIGGLGLMTLISMFAIFMKRKIGLSERMLLIQSSGNIRTNGVVQLIRRICMGTALFEGTGAVLLMFRFIPEFGPVRGIYYSIFHSISAFCNAGFDLMGIKEPFSSLTSYRNDLYVNLIIMALIIIGGIGFTVWSDFISHKLDFKNYSLHSKIVLLTTLSLLFGGTVLFWLLEPDTNLLTASFMSVTTRTAGFNTIPLDKLTDSGSVVAILLMFIGGSPGSTAGGVKTTTVAVILFSLICLSEGREQVTIHKRRIEDSTIKHATVICFVYLVAILAASILICSFDHLGMKAVLFETASASGTVGLTMGITTGLSKISRMILIILMYGGRIGGLSLLLVFAERKKEAPLKRPIEKILIG